MLTDFFKICKQSKYPSTRDYKQIVAYPYNGILSEKIQTQTGYILYNKICIQNSRKDKTTRTKIHLVVTPGTGTGKGKEEEGIF